MPELQQLNPEAHALLRRMHDDPWAEGEWLLTSDSKVGEDV